MSQHDLTDFEWRAFEPLHDKLAANFLAMVQLAFMRLWLRAYKSPT